MDNDFSKYISTGPLLKSAYILASDSVGIYINTVKPSIRGLYAFGSMGRLHNLLFDLDCVNLYSDKYGIYPYYTTDGQAYFPFRTAKDVRSEDAYALDMSHRFEIVDEHTAAMRNIAFYQEGEDTCSEWMPELAFNVTGNTLKITAVFPEKAQECCLHFPWYPLYDIYEANGEEKLLQYYKCGYYTEYEDDYSVKLKDSVLLSDSLSRQASLRVSALEGTIDVKGSTRPEMGRALYLSTDVTTSSRRLEVEIDVIPTNTVVWGTSFYACGSTAELCVGKQGRREFVDFPVSQEPGVHKWSISDTQQYFYCAVPDELERMKKAADACRKIMWKEGNLSDIPPYAFDPELLRPQLRSGKKYCSHGMRMMSCLCAEGVRSGDITYVDTVFLAFQKIEKVSRRFEDGALFTPIQMDDQGEPQNARNSSRPSDMGILIRGLIHTAKAYLYFGCEEKMRKCICLARDYAKMIARMQCEDGSFWERYCYSSGEPLKTSSIYKGTVNNWCLQLWNLLPLLRYIGLEADAIQIEGVVSAYIDSQLEKKPSILYITGGGEDAADFGDSMNTAATLFTIKYLLTGEEIWKEYAEQALKKSWFLSCMWADMPQYFGLYGNSDLGIYYDQPMGLFSAGGMHDLTAVEANLFAAKAYGSEFGREMAQNLHEARLGSFINDKGGMYMVVLQCPNFYYRDERHSETLMYGGVGVYAWEQVEKEIIDGLCKI